MSEKKDKAQRKASRRKFLKRGGLILAGTLVGGAYLGRNPFRRGVAEFAAGLDLPSGITEFAPDFWFEILEDNTILFRTPKAEMGQGIFTGLAMMAAEELEVPVEQIRVVPGSTANSPEDSAGTGGSSTTASLFIPVRQVAATLREMLKMAAANTWNVDISTIQCENGMLTSGDKSISFADLSSQFDTWEIPETPALKPRSEFRIIGKERPRTDLKPKVMGEPVFAIDAEMPGMVYAGVLNCPYIGGKLKSVDTSTAKAVAGVIRVVEEDDLVAVIASNRYAAEMGKRKLKANWDVPKVWEQKDIDELVKVGEANPENFQKEGNAQKLFNKHQGEVFEVEYRTPLAVHAHMEPNGALAHAVGEKITVIIGSQHPFLVRDEVAKALKISKKNVEVQNTYLGGGFGRRFFRNNAVTAARLARITGKPVYVFNDRQDEFQNGFFRPATHHVMRAMTTADGSIQALQHRMATGDMILGNMGIPGLKFLLSADLISAGHGARFLYAVEHRSASIFDVKLPFPTGIWRGVGMVPTTFATECFIDEIAHKMGKDPMNLRLNYLSEDNDIVKRVKSALEVLKQKVNWDNPKPDGIGRGVALAEDRKTISAAVAEVKIEDGKIKVIKVTQVIDPGFIINPEGVRTQVEGATMMGISNALYEGIYIKDGQFSATNYHQYPMATLKDTPEIDVILLEGSDKPSGVGEPPIAPIAPAIANAVFDLTGKRLRQLPLSKAWENANNG